MIIFWNVCHYMEMCISKIAMKSTHIIFLIYVNVNFIFEEFHSLKDDQMLIFGVFKPYFLSKFKIHQMIQIISNDEKHFTTCLHLTTFFVSVSKRQRFLSPFLSLRHDKYLNDESKFDIFMSMKIDLDHIFNRFKINNHFVHFHNEISWNLYR